MVKAIGYKCEKCCEVFDTIEEAFECEKSHKCPHKNTFYVITTDNDYFGMDILHIKNVCAECDIYVSESKDLHKCINQDKLKQIYDILGEKV